MAGEVRPRPGPAPSHSTPSLTAPVCHRPAQRTTEVPANSRHHGPRAVPSVSSVLILPPGPIADRHRRPQERLQAARRSPAYPNTSPDNRACNSLTPFRCPHAVHLYESVDSGLGYYRLLLGMSQKSFYGKEAGLGRFKSMETSGMLRQAQRECLLQLCLMLTDALSEMIRQFSPIPTTRDIQELPLLTLGAQFQGQRNVLIGQEATTDVFIAILDIVKPHIRHRSDHRVEILNASNRKVVIALSHDPDVRIQEEFGDHLRNKVAMEIKGGTDFSNIHNRAGEAEKSHQKAKLEGYRDYWTIIMMKGVSLTRLQEESPTTNSWFDAAQVLGQQGPDWNEFRSRVAEVAGIPEQ